MTDYDDMPGPDATPDEIADWMDGSFMSAIADALEEHNAQDDTDQADPDEE